MESDNPAEHHSVCKCLNTYFEALEIVFEKPFSTERVKQLIVDELPKEITLYFYQDSEALRQYCLALTEVLLTHQLKLSIARHLTGLLFDLTDYMAEDLSAPRFIRAKLLQYLKTK